MSSARDAILGALRQGLRGTAVPPLPPLRERALPGEQHVATFTSMLTRVGGTVDVVQGRAAARARLAELLAEAKAQTVACSDAPELRDLLPKAVRTLPHDAPRSELLAADCGLTSAQFGIAETGTLVLCSGDERHRLASLLPARHICLLPRSRLCGTLAEVLAKVHRDGAPSSRTITFVTGPSRTADIELTLVVGVHGPKFLHVLLLDDEH
jgi:L-lactate dehydrogenase complex protein LldG